MLFKDKCSELGDWGQRVLREYKEPLEKQAALVYNLIRKVYRTRSSDLPSVKF